MELSIQFYFKDDFEVQSAPMQDLYWGTPEKSRRSDTPVCKITLFKQYEELIIRQQAIEQLQSHLLINDQEILYAVQLYSQIRDNIIEQRRFDVFLVCVYTAISLNNDSRIDLQKFIKLSGTLMTESCFGQTQLGIMEHMKFDLYSSKVVKQFNYDK